MANNTEVPKAESTTRDVKETAKKAAANVQQKAASAATQAKETIIDVTNEAKNEATSALKGVKNQAYVAAEEQKDRTTDRLSSVAGALRQTSQEFRSREDQTFAQYTEMAADQVDQFASYLDTNDMGQLIDGVHDFARRQPEIFIAGALTAGFFLGRFLKSSQSNRNDQPTYFRTSSQGQYRHPDYYRAGQQSSSGEPTHGEYTPYKGYGQQPQHDVDERDHTFSGGATAYNGERSTTGSNVQGNETDWGSEYGAAQQKGDI